MTFDIQYAEDTGLFVVETHGRLDTAAMNRLVGALMDHPAWGEGRALLLDHSDSPGDHLTPADLRAIADQDIRNGQLFAGIRFAMVVGSDHDLGLARMWEAFVAGELPYKARVFRHRHEAETWLAAGCRTSG